MTELLRFAPLLAAAVVVAVVLVSTLTLFRRHLHPLEVLVRAVSAASMIGILGLIGIVPPTLWWLPWLLALGVVGGTALACRRLLTSDPPAEPTRREARHLTRPGIMNVLAEAVIYLALVIFAVTAG
ncbi:hypothetical protein [Brachybacterium fresconis]|uniref:DUF5134 domain-containing protein n=1 Tax=Brachybacterium fresconis TaxID=173363 RepID=A0ABS4YM89_9MICO|nr:hypothetical protein [Brachybacterium fresconis]MBP2409859.1 hypothetical protein [Brachybacterium fresconis]